MAPLSEEEFRALLDERGLLRDDALACPDATISHVVFAQRTDARLDVEAMKSQAQQFLATKLGITVDKHYGPSSPAVDAARIVVANDDARASGTRLCFGRPATLGDLAAAEEAERAMGTYGLALLAMRCKTIWTVQSETPDDRCALTIAAIFAMTLLGPIVTPGRREIFGIRGARLKLEATR